MDPQYPSALDNEMAISPGLMNDTTFDSVDSTTADKALSEADTCRICRSEGTHAEPLFFPCKCSGSIKYVHQDCLMEWLSHSNKKYCELCKTAFRFTKLYDSHMPATLPLHIFLRKAALHTVQHLLTWARGLAVATVWLLVLPWCIRWSWRGLFWLLDAGWARDAWLAKEENTIAQTASSISLADSVEASLNATTITSPPIDTSPEPVVLNLSKVIITALLGPWRPFSSQKVGDDTDPVSLIARAASSSLLSDVKSLNSLTSSPYLNRSILDILEGQIITALIVVAFILVFLIREWVVQQQPIINAAAQLRDAQIHVEIVDQAAQQLRDAQLRQQRVPEEDLAQLIDRLVQDAPNRDRAPDDVGNPATDTDEAPEQPYDRDATTELADAQTPGSEQPSPFLAYPPQADAEGDNANENANRPPVDPPRAPASSQEEMLHAWEGDGQGAHEVERRSSEDSWQTVDHSAQDQRDGTVTHSDDEHEQNAGRGLQDTEHLDHEPAQSSDRDPHASPEVPAPTIDATSSSNQVDEPIAAHQPQVVDEGDSQHNGEPVHDSAQGTDPDAYPENSEQTSPAQPETAVDAPTVNVLQSIYDYFWGDITADADGLGQQNADAFVEAIIGNEAEEEPFVRVPGPGGDVPAGLDNDVPAQDPEVAQAAADVGLDADALDEAEDLEGILELIGMQGPLVGLLQTAMFCGVLITTTLWAALGAPYMFGKFALLFLGDPIVFSIMAPIKIISLVSDALIDSTIYLGGLVTYFAAQLLSHVSAWIFRVTYTKVEAKSFDFVAVRAHNAITAAGSRLSGLFAKDSPFEAGVFVVSLHAHQSLQTLQKEAAQVVAFSVHVAAKLTNHLQRSTTGQILSSLMTCFARELAQAKRYYLLAQGYLRNSFATSIDNGTLILTDHRAPTHLDPSLAYWSATDRCMTILAGYIFLATIGTMYLLRQEPLFSNPGLQRVEKALTDFLKQAGGVLKVILIISIEMLAFPLYCGMLLDFALLPLFGQASIGIRVLFALRSPWMFAFIHWFIGTCYMFHFALFVSACRRVMRKGVLYFIRDPDDPTFHPVRDVLERNVTTQLRKIAFSAMVYGGLVICCLGGVVWGIDLIFTGVFPVRWATPEPLLEFPMDFLVYNLVAPIVARHLLPSQGLEDIFKSWLQYCARALRLSHFLFGDRRRDEEGYTVKMPSSTAPGDSRKAEFVRDGKYVRAPASDQVRIPKGDKVFLEVTADNRRVDGRPDPRTGLHGRKNKNFTKVYIPPWFRLRISLFIFSLWLFAAGTGVCLTVLPMVFGRLTLGMMTPERIDFNDLYAFSVGLVVLGTVLWIVLRSRAAYGELRGNVFREMVMAAMTRAGDVASRVLRSLYVYSFGVVVVPSLLALVFELYLILPLHTYTTSWSATSDAESSGPPSGIKSTSMSLLAGHNIHMLQAWTLGLLYFRVGLRIVMMSRNSRPATALRLITRDGYMNPNAKLATRAVIAPTLLLFSVLLLFPPVFAKVTNGILLALNFPMDSMPHLLHVKMYRYSYPLCASQALVIWGVWELVKATRRWRGRIKDEVYLIGERLHNFGERRAPDGSKSTMLR